jgi:hypothetical protein
MENRDPLGSVSGMRTDPNRLTRNDDEPTLICHTEQNTIVIGVPRAPLTPYRHTHPGQTV